MDTTMVGIVDEHPCEADAAAGSGGPRVPGEVPGEGAGAGAPQRYERG